MGIMASTAGPLGGPRSCSAPLLAALSHYCVCLGKISNVKALQHPEHAVKGDAAERTAGKRDRDGWAQRRAEGESVSTRGMVLKGRKKRSSRQRKACLESV